MRTVAAGKHSPLQSWLIATAVLLNRKEGLEYCRRCGAIHIVCCCQRQEDMHDKIRLTDARVSERSAAASDTYLHEGDEKHCITHCQPAICDTLQKHTSENC